MLPEWLLEKIITTLEDYIMPCTRSTTGSSTFFTRYKAKGQLMRSLQTVQKELQELQELKRKKGKKISNIKTTTRPSVQYLLLSLFLLLKTRKQTWKKDYNSQLLSKQERGGREDLIYTTKYWDKQSQYYQILLHVQLYLWYDNYLYKYL